MDDVFEVFSKLNVYVQGVRTIHVSFKIKLNTFFDIAVVCKRKSFAFLQDIPKYLSGSVLDTLTIS